MPMGWWVDGLAGGALIGVAAVLVLITHGRVAGLSGILGRALVDDDDGGRRFRIAFLAGLVVTGIVVARLDPTAIGPSVAGPTGLVVAGLLVGIGASLGNGCTSGHGVCGISRGSMRSIVAVITFIATGMITVAIAGALR